MNARMFDQIISTTAKAKNSTLIQHLIVILTAGLVFFVQGPRFVYHLWDHLYEGGDSFLNSWILSWNAHALFKSGISVWDAPIFYPAKNALAFSETMFGNLWITLPVQYFTDNPTFAANMLLLASFVLGMYCVFLLVYNLTQNFWAGLIAGLVFSFNPYRWEHAGHLQLLPFFWAPLALLCANRFLATLKRRYFFGMLTAVWVQYYASIYLGTMLLTLLAILFLVHFTLKRREPDRWILLTNPHFHLTLLAGLVLSITVLLPLGLPYMQTAKHWHFIHDLSANSLYSAEPLGFFLRPSLGFAHYDWLAGLFRIDIRGGEGAVFIGLTPCILAFLGLVMVRLRQSPLTTAQKYNARRYVWTALIISILMLGPYLIFFNRNTGIPMPYQIVYHVIPGAKAMRVPARFFQPFLLCMAIVGGFGIAALLDIWKKWPGFIKLLTIIAFCFLLRFDYAVRDNEGAFAETLERFPPVYSYLAKSPDDGPVLELPVGRRGRDLYAYKYLHYQTAYWRPKLGGQSGWYTPSADALSHYTEDCPHEDCFKFIGLTPASTLIVHLNKYSKEDISSWAVADLQAYGLRFAGQFGDSLVWERHEMAEQVCEKLTVVWSHWKVTNSGIDINFIVKPAQKGKAWRKLTLGSSDISVMLTTKQGEQVKYKSSFKIPPYILPGKHATVWLSLPEVNSKGDLASLISSTRRVASINIARIQFEGSLITHQNRSEVALMAANRQYVSAEGDMGDELIVNADLIGYWETFELIDLGGNQVAFMASNGKFVCAEGGGGMELVANRDVIASWEIFKLIDIGKNQVAIKAVNGQYVTAENGKLFANKNSTGKWETFTLVETDRK